MTDKLGAVFNNSESKIMAFLALLLTHHIPVLNMHIRVDFI